MESDMSIRQASTITELPLSQLRIDDKANVRKIGVGAEKDFVASILALGIQMPLIVRKNGKGYEVADGGKRLSAAQALVKNGEWNAEAMIPCVITEATDAEARELSLALNLVRADMHPVDAFRAFVTLHTNKEMPLDVPAIATRFGIGIKLVNQRLALGALDDKILDAWRDGKIDQDAAQAFTLCPNKKEQVRIYDKLAKQRSVNDFAIKRELKAGANVSRALCEVGIEAYEKRGGKVTRDLFGDDHAISDESLLRTMLSENLDATVKRLESEGWSWVATKRPENAYSFGEIKVEADWTKEDRAEHKRLKAIMEGDPEDADEQSDASAAAEEAIDALEQEVVLRSYTPVQKAKAGCWVFRDYNGALKIEHGRVRPEDRKAAAKEQRQAKAKAPKGKTAPKGPPILTNALRDRLGAHRRTAIKAAILTDTEKRDPLFKMLGGIVAGLIRPESNYSSAPDGVQRAYDTLANTITPKVMNAALRKAFDAKGYFEGCGKAFCLAAITEAVNADEARKISKGKRGDIAKFALINVGKTGWLPKELRTPHYDGPGAKKAAIKTKKRK
jgi:ParB family chromosome partitioning protein